MKIVQVMVSLAIASMAPTALAQTPNPAVLTNGRFEQVALTVSSLPDALILYRDRLGLRLMFEANNMLFFDVGGVRLMIAGDRSRQKPAAPTGILYFHVDDFAAALSRLQRTGVKLVGSVETVQSSTTGMLQLQQFEDLDGNMLAIMGFVPR